MKNAVILETQIFGTNKQIVPSVFPNVTYVENTRAWMATQQKEKYPTTAGNTIDA